MRQKKTILAIDIGSSKVCSVIADINNDVPYVTGVGICKSAGIKKGAVVDIERVSRAIITSVDDAKRVAGSNISRAIISISGAYTESINVVAITNISDESIGSDAITRTIKAAVYNAVIPKGYEILHVIPFSFKLDDCSDIEDPINMTGSKLEVEARIITAKSSDLANLKKAVKLAKIEVENVVLSSYAASIAVLDDDERKIGISCIDIGGSTSELMVYLGNGMRYNDFIKVGSDHITNDLSIILSTPQSVAEEIKEKYINLEEQASGDIEVPITGSQSDKRYKTHPIKIVYDIVFCRVRETLQFLDASLEKSGLKSELGGGVVLTGGMMKLAGVREIACETFMLPVRVGKPKRLEGLSEDLCDVDSAVVVGLILYGAGYSTKYEQDSSGRIYFHREKKIAKESPVSKTLGLGEDEEPKENLSEIRKLDDKKPNAWTKFKQWGTKLF